MSCPWAKIEKPEPVNFSEILSEEVARDIQAKEEKKVRKFKEIRDAVPSVLSNDVEISDISSDELKTITNEEFESDETIARMLQIQFDKEHDDQLKRTEKKYNGTSKVSISFDNYRRTPLNDDFESDSEEEEKIDIRDRKDWDRFDSLQKNFASIPRCGYKIQQDGKMVTKHDGVMNGRKNACKLLSFPPGFQTGDGENIDLRLSNQVFNSLKMHSKHEQRKRHKIHDKKEDQATAEFGLDEFTTLLLYKLINNQLFERVNGIISIGKEAVILHADTDPAARDQLPKECVIKVFKTTLSEFKQRDKYIKDDYRFKDKIGKQTARKTVHIWAEKEMANLMRLKRAGILCPHVVMLKKHVLVMSFIGEDHRAAPKLKDAKMKEADYIVAYDEVIQAMKTLYEKANLIHADLSEYNILWHNEECYFIDVSQSVEPSHENAFHFLYRDCNNIINFFAKKGVRRIHTPDDLFRHITGCDFSDTVALSALQESFKLKPHLLDSDDLELVHNFETVWERAKSRKIPVENVTAEVDSNLVEPMKA